VAAVSRKWDIHLRMMQAVRMPELVFNSIGIYLHILFLVSAFYLLSDIILHSCYGETWMVSGHSTCLLWILQLSHCHLKKKKRVFMG